MRMLAPQRYGTVLYGASSCRCYSTRYIASALPVRSYEYYDRSADADGAPQATRTASILDIQQHHTVLAVAYGTACPPRKRAYSYCTILLTLQLGPKARLFHIYFLTVVPGGASYKIWKSRNVLNTK